MSMSIDQMPSPVVLHFAILFILHTEWLGSPVCRLDGRAEPCFCTAPFAKSAARCPRHPGERHPGPCTRALPDTHTSATGHAHESGQTCTGVPPATHSSATGHAHESGRTRAQALPCRPARGPTAPARLLLKSAAQRPTGPKGSGTAVSVPALLGWHSFLPIMERINDVALLIANNSLDYKFYVLYS